MRPLVYAIHESHRSRRSKQTRSSVPSRYLGDKSNKAIPAEYEMWKGTDGKATQTAGWSPIVDDEEQLVHALHNKA